MFYRISFLGKSILKEDLGKKGRPSLMTIVKGHIGKSSLNTDILTHLFMCVKYTHVHKYERVCVWVSQGRRTKKKNC